MAWHIFIFLWRIWMILGKIPVSKFLQNLPVQFFKVLPNPKFKRNLKRIFLSWPGSSFQPIRPLSPPLALGCHPLSARLPSPAFGLSSPLPAGPQPAGRPSRQPPLSLTCGPYPVVFLPRPIATVAASYAHAHCLPVPFHSRNSRSTPPSSLTTTTPADPLPKRPPPSTLWRTIAAARSPPMPDRPAPPLTL
jgi:hypothetical protein